MSYFIDIALSAYYNLLYSKNHCGPDRWGRQSFDCGRPIQDAVHGQFLDIKEADWFYGAVKFAIDNGLFNGVSDYEFAAIIQRLAEA